MRLAITLTREQLERAKEIEEEQEAHLIAIRLHTEAVRRLVSERRALREGLLVLGVHRGPLARAG